MNRKTIFGVFSDKSLIRVLRVPITSLSREKSSDEEPDYFDKLSDKLLCHILRFMPTRSAVKTSILSKRWKDLWTTVPLIDFTDLPDSVRFRCLNTKQDIWFRNFVDKVLDRNNVTYIQRVKFCAFSGLDADYINEWIDLIMKRTIREIHLIMWLPVELPLSVLARERLVVLRIAGHFLIDVPSLNLPNLEMMYVSGVTFVGDGVLKLFSSECPVLRELSMVGCQGLNRLYVYSQSLKKLEIRRLIWESCETPVFVDVKSPNIQYLVLEEGWWVVHEGDSRVEYDFGEMSRLVQGKLCVSSKTQPGQLLQLMRKIPNVERLVLGSSTIECFRTLVDEELPVFLNLTHLGMEVCDNMAQVLTCAPNLVHLFVGMCQLPCLLPKSRSKITARCLNVNLKGWLARLIRKSSFRAVRSCVLSLEFMEIQGFEGRTYETEIVGYFLQNAVCLKQIKLHSHDTSSRRPRDAYNKLLASKMASSTSCQLIFCSSCTNYH